MFFELPSKDPRSVDRPFDARNADKEIRFPHIWIPCYFQGDFSDPLIFPGRLIAEKWAAPNVHDPPVPFVNPFCAAHERASSAAMTAGTLLKAASVAVSVGKYRLNSTAQRALLSEAWIKL